MTKQFAIENGYFSLVDLPINSIVIFHSYVKRLPEGNLQFWILSGILSTWM